jgi:hypothetical protein
MRSCPPSPEWTAHENIARLPSAYGSFARRLRRSVKAVGPRPWAHFPPLVPRPLPHQPAARRRGTVHRLAPCPAVSCRWAAAHPGAALGAWRVSPGAARAPSQASARPLPQGRARRPSRSAPTTTGSSRTPSGTSRTLAVPTTHHTTSRADPLRPNAATGPPLRHALAPRPVPHRPAGPARCAGASMKGESGGRCADAAAAPAGPWPDGESAARSTPGQIPAWSGLPQPRREQKARP